jgi:NAD(P)H-flavin reductase
MEPIPFRVTGNLAETHDTFTLMLEPPDGEFTFVPGQINMLYAFGVGEVPISVSGDPDRPGELIHTIREVGAVTGALHRLRRGDFVGVRGPFGVPWPVKEAEGGDVVIIGGGIGLAPLRPVIYHVLNNRDRYGRVIVLYGARSPRDLLFQEELGHWRSRFDMEVEVTVDNADRSWRGGVGVVTRLISRSPFDTYLASAFVCGPEIMMRYAIEEFERRGLSADRIFLTMERNMKCSIGVCGHCQFGPHFVCKDGPVFPYSTVKDLIWVREV